MKHLVWLLALAACGSNKSGNHNADAQAGSGSDSGSNTHHDAAADSRSVDAEPAPPMITISGTAQTLGATGGTTPATGVVVGAYARSNPNTAVQTATTDGSGNFTMTVSTGGVALDGFLKATDSGYLDTYVWPPAPLAANFSGASVNFINSFDESIATGTLCQVSGGQKSSDALIALEVHDGSGNTIGGVAVAANPAAAKVCYDGSNGLPSASPTTTGSDGVALLINVPAGNTTLSATKTGATYGSHVVNGIAGAFTTTIIVQN